MNIKKMSKIISAVLIISTILSAFCAVFASPSIPSAVSPTTGAQDVNNVAGIVIYIIQIIAFAAAVIMLMFVGIKFLTASPEGKAEIKKTAVIYVVGAVLLFAAGGILTILQTLSQNIGSGTASN